MLQESQHTPLQSQVTSWSQKPQKDALPVGPGLLSMSPARRRRNKRLYLFGSAKDAQCERRGEEDFVALKVTARESRLSLAVVLLGRRAFSGVLPTGEVDGCPKMFTRSRTPVAKTVVKRKGGCADDTVMAVLAVEWREEGQLFYVF